MARSLAKAIFTLDVTRMDAIRADRPGLNKLGKILRQASPAVLSGGLAAVVAGLGGDAAAILAALGAGAWAGDGAAGHFERRFQEARFTREIEGANTLILRIQKERDLLSQQIEGLREQSSVGGIGRATLLPDDPARLRERIIGLQIEAAGKRGELLEACGHLLKTQEAQGLVQPRRLGDKYIVIEKIGEGGYGTVSAVYHQSMEALMVVKESLDVARLKTEAQLSRKAQKQLQNQPHAAKVCSIVDFDDKNGLAVMDYIPGLDLKTVLDIARRYPLREAPALTIMEAGEVMRQILNAFKVIHHGLGVQVVHRDLKPENMMLTKWQREGRQNLIIVVNLLDFGIAKRRDRRATMDSRNVLGTPHYMAPEQWHGSDVTYKADIYAKGILLFEMLTGRVPFEPPPEIGAPELFNWGMYQLPQLIRAGVPDISKEQIGRIYPPTILEPIQEFLMSTITVDPRERGDAEGLLEHIETMMSAAESFEPTVHQRMGG